MATARRIVLPPAPSRGRRRVGVLAVGLVGGSAGLAVGAACVAWSPARGPAPEMQVRPVAQGVAAVLMPAAQADVGPRGRRDDAEAP